MSPLRAHTIDIICVDKAFAYGSKIWCHALLVHASTCHIITYMTFKHVYQIWYSLTMHVLWSVVILQWLLYAKQHHIPALHARQHCNLRLQGLHAYWATQRCKTHVRSIYTCIIVTYHASMSNTFMGNTFGGSM